MGLNAGALATRVTIKRIGSVQDAAGQSVDDWSDLATVWADVRHLSGVESIQGGAEASTVQASIRIRRRTDVDAGMRVHKGASIYEIKAVLPDDERRERLDLVCELVDGG